MSDLRDGAIQAMTEKMSDAVWTDCDYCEQCEIEGCVGHEEPSFAPSVLLDAWLDYLQEQTPEVEAAARAKTEWPRGHEICVVDLVKALRNG